MSPPPDLALSTGGQRSLLAADDPVGQSLKHTGMDQDELQALVLTYAVPYLVAFVLGNYVLHGCMDSRPDRMTAWAAKVYARMSKCMRGAPALQVAPKPGPEPGSEPEPEQGSEPEPEPESELAVAAAAAAAVESPAAGAPLPTGSGICRAAFHSRRGAGVAFLSLLTSALLIAPFALGALFAVEALREFEPTLFGAYFLLVWPACG